ncbi:hypothetical protein CO704_14910 [Cedecea neteri]|uniref:Uncharacterized protein n=1 Tax=Cedecea neteri TaxID=158822 RepID=A0A291DZT0_9ENTR|nr:hypothetical protein CO704_14910 [Cedecea neteri]
MQNGCPAVLANPVEGSHPSLRVQHAKKKPAFACELFFKYGGEGGMDSQAHPFGAALSQVMPLSNLLKQVVEPGRGFSSVPRGVTGNKKA